MDVMIKDRRDATADQAAGDLIAPGAGESRIPVDRLALRGAPAQGGNDAIYGGNDAIYGGNDAIYGDEAE